MPTTDWGKKETLLHWREEWANYVNQEFAKKGLPCRLDHRTLEEQGIDRLPTIHEGPNVRAMEAKGIATDKGNFNRWVKETSSALQKLRRKIKELLAWLKEIKAELSAPNEPTLADYLSAYFAQRNDEAGIIGAEKAEQAIKGDHEFAARIELIYHNPPPKDYGKDYNNFLCAEVSAERAQHNHQRAR